VKSQYTQIPLDEWSEFCQEFSVQHRGWLATVGLSDTQAVDLKPLDPPLEIIAQHLSFEGLELKLRNGPERKLSVTMGEQQWRMTHVVHEPLRIWVEQSEQGAHRGLRVDNARGKSMLLRFRVPAVPETLDGLAESELR
jgi:hypothetical protein